MGKIKWNEKLKLVLSDVDETVADLYSAATSEMCVELERLLEQGIVLFLITGQSRDSVQWRITNNIKPGLRKRILVGHCSGAEVWGFDDQGVKNEKPFYSVYDNALSDEQKKRWREIVEEVVKEFKLDVHPTMTLEKFKEEVGNNPLSIMLEDRGPQITFEFVNGYNISPEQEASLEIKVPNTHGNLDLRIPVLERIDQLLQENNLRITPRLAGVFAIDLAIKGTSKTTAIHKILDDENTLKNLGLSKLGLLPENLEIWGDKFSEIRGGTDRHMSEALPKEVRSITFREENPSEFPEGYKIVIWDGEKHLHNGLLEFLQGRSMGSS